MITNFDKNLIFTEISEKNYKGEVIIHPDASTIPSGTINAEMTTRQLTFVGTAILADYEKLSFATTDATPPFSINMGSEIVTQSDMVDIVLENASIGQLQIGSVAIEDTDYPPPYTQNTKNDRFSYLQVAETNTLNTEPTSALTISCLKLLSNGIPKSQIDITLRHKDMSSGETRWVASSKGYQLMYDDTNDNLTIVLFVEKDGTFPLNDPSEDPNITFSGKAFRDSDGSKGISIILYEDDGSAVTWGNIATKKAYYKF